jgi:hypothetical protein
MKANKNLGLIVLAVWLILSGGLPLLNISFPSSNLVMNILAIAAGSLILIQSDALKKPKSQTGFLLLSLWLILQGGFALLSVSFTGKDSAMALLAIASGILLLIGR